MRPKSQNHSAQFEGQDRFNVLDFAEAAQIPVATARRLIKDLGDDAATLMRAVTEDAESVSLDSRARQQNA